MSRHVTWNVNLFQNGELDAWDEHNMGSAGPMTKHTELANLPDVLLFLLSVDMRDPEGKNISLIG